MPRPRDRVLQNLEAIYRDAYERAKAAGDQARLADLVVSGGVLWTGLSRGRPRPGAVAIARGKIQAVGDSSEVARYVGPRTVVLRARAGLVMPGFTDGHTHFIDGGFQLASVNLRD